MRRRISVFRRAVYIFFGVSGVIATVVTGFWYGNVMATIFHTTVLVAATNWGVLGITGKDAVEWIEVASKKP